MLTRKLLDKILPYEKLQISIFWMNLLTVIFIIINTLILLFIISFMYLLFIF